MIRWCVRFSTAIVSCVLATSGAQAQPGPIPSLRAWADASTVIVTGRVLDTHETPDTGEGLPISHKAVASIRIASVLKGKVEASEISIEFQGLRKGYGTNAVYPNVYSLHVDDYGILFLKKDREGDYVFANPDVDLLPVVQNAPLAETAITTMSKIEGELIETVSDPIHGRHAAQLLDMVSWCWTAVAFRGDVNPANPDNLKARGYIGLLRCGDYSILGKAVELAEKPTNSASLLKRQAEIAEAIGEIGDNRQLQVMKPEGYRNVSMCASRSKVPFNRSVLLSLHPLLSVSNENLRRGAAHALRGICDPTSAPYLASALKVSDPDLQYEALMGLDALEGFSKGLPAPTAEAFKRDPAKYLACWRNWWEINGRLKYSANSFRESPKQ